MEGKGLIVGGLLPALAFGFSGLLQKAASRTSPGLGPYLLCIGLGVLVVGAFYTLATQDRTISYASGGFALGIGVLWSLGTVLVAVGIARYSAPLAKLVPLYNMNTLVVALLAMVVFAEAREVVVSRLLVGALLVVAGGLVVARA